MKKRRRASSIGDEVILPYLSAIVLLILWCGVYIRIKIMKKTCIRLAFLLALAGITACVYRKPYSVALDRLPCDEGVQENLKEGAVYLHDKTSSYTLAEPIISDSVIKGTIVWKVSPAGPVHLSDLSDRKEQRKHKKDIHIYLKNDIVDISAALGDKPVPMNIQKQIRPSEIERIEVLRVDNKASVSNSLLAVVLILFGILLFAYLLVYTIGLASANASGQSRSNSGDSGSGKSGNSGSDSNSNSGDSGSGGSGGSGSDSNSGGCYIATMVYGSYDAPEVLVLRRFRDEVLAPTTAGQGFIKLYYTLSPRFVRIFQHSKGINATCKWLLDKWVARLSR